MGLPVFLQPSIAANRADATRSELDPEVAAVCSALWDEARSAWRLRPPEGSEAEARALQPTFELLLTVANALGASAGAALREDVNEGLRGIVHDKQRTADDDRSFALRQLEQALGHYGVVVERLALLPGFDEVLVRGRAAEASAHGLIPPALRPLYRANGALFMAFDEMTSPQTDEFRYWAGQAVERWRSVVARIDRLDALLRSALAHLRAREAWTEWTEEDRRVEHAASICES